MIGFFNLTDEEENLIKNQNNMCLINVTEKQKLLTSMWLEHYS